MKLSLFIICLYNYIYSNLLYILINTVLIYQMLYYSQIIFDFKEILLFLKYKSFRHIEAIYLSDYQTNYPQISGLYGRDSVCQVHEADHASRDYFVQQKCSYYHEVSNYSVATL